MDELQLFLKLYVVVDISESWVHFQVISVEKWQLADSIWSQMSQNVAYNFLNR